MRASSGRHPWLKAVPGAVVVLLVATALWAIFLLAPTEQTMGDAQRIVYIHVSVAWVALAGFLVTAATGLMVLVRRDLWWDQWSLAAAEVGWLGSSLTLVTGSLWARSAWGTWWTWDPRLTTAFILWAMYCGYLILRGSLEEPHRRARLSAVFAVVGVLDVPLVVMATRWFRGIHPSSPEMEPSMRVVLLLSLIGFTVFFVVLFVRRRGQLRLESLLASLQRRSGL